MKLNIILVMFISQFQKPNTFEEDTKKRLNTMQKACKKHGLDIKGTDTLHQPKGWEYFIADYGSTNLVWCNIFKSASTR